MCEAAPMRKNNEGSGGAAVGGIRRKPAWPLSNFATPRRKLTSARMSVV
eukprot:CAMPEP_0176134480 /NCGR_PEP_ID=MMETSP0120_2-20121206/68200_1 /TAXON_ID=160619 /ORGANISM="Kryptoperidinium foliaceum, Strain CCMP 1326" /LENGTH=48 /DNA_ID= /DNA_START= /DNA_END= /DNA_ORIENTATION=